VSCVRCAAELQPEALSASGKSAQPSFMDERVEYRGYVIFWRKPLNGGKWTANIASGSPSLFPAFGMNDAIDGKSRDDMLNNARMYLDRLLDDPSAAWLHRDMEPQPDPA
jgi:hypothetical protein